MPKSGRQEWGGEEDDENKIVESPRIRGSGENSLAYESGFLGPPVPRGGRELYNMVVFKTGSRVLGGLVLEVYLRHGYSAARRLAEAVVADPGGALEAVAGNAVLLRGLSPGVREALLRLVAEAKFEVIRREAVEAAARLEAAGCRGVRGRVLEILGLMAERGLAWGSGWCVAAVAALQLCGRRLPRKCRGTAKMLAAAGVDVPGFGDGGGEG